MMTSQSNVEELSNITDITDGKWVLKNPSMQNINAWFENYKAEQEEIGAYLKEPSETLLTNFYAENVVNGTFIASKKVILACKRHLYDLKKSLEDPNYPFYFDEKAGHLPIIAFEQELGNNLVMQPWQHAWIGMTYGWLNKSDDTRRYDDALVMTAMKNGKTTMVSGISIYMLSKYHEINPKCYIIANNKEQASIAYGSAVRMVEESPNDLTNKKWSFKDRFVIKNGKINRGYGYLEALTSELKGKDGKQPYLLIFDEIHEMLDDELINVLQNKFGSYGNELAIKITTAGSVIDGPLYNYWLESKTALNDFDSPFYERNFYWVAEMDDFSEIDDLNLWVKANPNICCFNDFTKVVNQTIKGLKMPNTDAYYRIIRTRFNLFTTGNVYSYVDSETIDKNSDCIDLETLKGFDAYIGYDLSVRDDFTSVVTIIPIDDGRLVIDHRSFIPDSKLKQSSSIQSGLSFWKESGELVIAGDDVVDLQIVENYIIEQSQFYNVLKVGYDNFNSTYLNKNLKKLDLEMFMVPQNYKGMSEPLKEFRSLLANGKIVFNKSSMYRWYLNNALTKTDNQDNLMLIKPPGKKTRKNDGISATMDAFYVRMMDIIEEPTEVGTFSFFSMDDIAELMREEV